MGLYLVLYCGITRSCGKSMFSLLRNCQSFFQSCCTVLYSHQQCMRIPITIHLCQYLLPIFEFNHPSGYEVISHCGTGLMSLMTNDVEHLFLCLLENCPFRSLSVFNWVVFLLLSYMHCLYILDTSHFSDIWFANIHSVGCLHFVDSIIWSTKF